MKKVISIEDLKSRPVEEQCTILKSWHEHLTVSIHRVDQFLCTVEGNSGLSAGEINKIVFEENRFVHTLDKNRIMYQERMVLRELQDCVMGLLAPVEEKISFIREAEFHKELKRSPHREPPS